MRPQSLIVVGCGPHYRTRYQPVLEDLARRGKVEFAAAIDLTSQRAKVTEWFAGRFLKPQILSFLPEVLRNPNSPDMIHQALGELRGAIRGASAALICTEPKAHRAYAIWAFQSGLDVFMDKPITAPSPARPFSSFLDEHAELEAARRRAGARCVVSCERRLQAGYAFLYSEIERVMRRYGMPISSVNISFAGGNWYTADEYLSRENHPYKYGYGLMLHSGYHFVDLLAYLLGLNQALYDLDFGTLRLAAFCRRPADVLMFGPPLGASSRAPKALGDVLGETDVQAIGDVGGGGPHVQFALSLTDISVTNRSTDAPLQDTYLGSGRLRQEDVIVHLGHIFSIHVHSDAMTPEDPRTRENFAVTIFENSAYTGGALRRRIGRYELGELTGIGAEPVLNTLARQDQLRSFLAGGDGNSRLSDHRDTAVLLDRLFTAIQPELSLS